MNTSNTFNRLEQYLEWYTNELGGTVQSFEKKCGISNGYVNSLKKRPGGQIKLDIIEKIKSAFPALNRCWLAFGIGGMFCDETAETVVNVKSSSVSPYYNTDFLGGFSEVENNPSIEPVSFIDMPPFNGKDFIWCNITGNDMSPLILQGSRICLKKIKGGIDEILYGEIYALVIIHEGIELRTVKRVVRADDETKVRLRPENVNCGTFQDFPKASIKLIYKVVFAGTVFGY